MLLFVFQFEGSISVLTQMMVDPAVTEKRGGGKNLPLRRGEILDVIQFTNQEQILCRNSQRRCKSLGAEALPAAGITAHKVLGTSFFVRTHPRTAGDVPFPLGRPGVYPGSQMFPLLFTQMSRYSSRSAPALLLSAGLVASLC